MRIKEAIARADKLRPNTIDDAQKAAWIYEIEGKLAETMKTEAPERLWPEDQELSMPSPYDNIYALYIMAMADFANMETDEYTNDMTVFNAAYAEAVAWWRRHHRPKQFQNWRTM